MAAQLKILEQHLTTYAADPMRVRNYWQSFWRTYGALPSINWGTVSWSKWGGFGSQSRKVGIDDLSEIRDIFGVQLSCAAVAEIANEILGRAGSGYTVKCGGSDSGCSFSPGVRIDPFLQ